MNQYLFYILYIYMLYCCTCNSFMFLIKNYEKDIGDNGFLTNSTICSEYLRIFESAGQIM